MSPQLPAILLSAAAALSVGLKLPPVRARRLPTTRPTSSNHPAALSARRFIALLRRRRPVITPDDVAAWCDELARRVRAGSSLSSALTETIPPDPSLRAATDPIRLAIARGRPVGEAVTAEGSTPAVGATHLSTARSVIAVAATLGGSAAAPLDRVAAALRLRAVDGQERSTHSAQARLSAHVMTVVPLVMLGVLVAADPDVRAVVARPIGAGCVSLGLVLNLSGWTWMRRTIGRSR